MGGAAEQRETLAEEDYLFLAVEEATRPAKGGFFMHHVDAWWLVHPDKGLAFYNPRHPRTGRRRFGRYGAPQCNADERIARKVGLDTAPWPDPEVRFLRSAWVPVDIDDYRQ